ncbi:unnamed protein product [Orchesella dallaii]|uniref:Odorant receptor n=1 Tax=Orchesella dallaii TaxID=48710 RepID=A0ABP1Q1X2_9HEXA
MLHAERILSALIEHLKFSAIFASIPFEWNKEKGGFELKTRTNILIHKVRLRTALLYAASILLQVVVTWKQATIFVKMHTILFFSAMIMTCYTHHVFFTNRVEIVAYINAMISFEKRRNAKEWRPKDLLGIITKLLMRILSMSGIMLPVLYHFELIRLPCMPMHLGYFLLENCPRGTFGKSLPATWSLEEIIGKVMIFTVSYFNWSFLMSGFAAHISIGLLLKGHCLRSYILLFRKVMIGSSKRNANSHSSSKSIFFRELQIMSANFRWIYACYMNVGIVVSCMIVQIISLYSCFKLGSKLPVPMLIFYCMAAVDCGFVILVVYGGLAEVYKVSKCLNKELKGKVDVQVNRWFRTFFKSCQIIKVHFGETSCIDEMTPLNFEDFVIQQTVSLLLLK